MDELFEKFERGEMPNFIELMAAISEISKMWPGEPCLDCRQAGKEISHESCNHDQGRNLQRQAE
ncbi:unnamed protein product [marine sediment metagenome]|uniref:Uncharacterized protein n=1 Tax=marine sediment metagenome TaxID=412755 RepID=X1UGQ7_9ZZZZ